MGVLWALVWHKDELNDKWTNGPNGLRSLSSLAVRGMLTNKSNFAENSVGGPISCQSCVWGVWVGVGVGFGWVSEPCLTQMGVGVTNLVEQKKKDLEILR